MTPLTCPNVTFLALDVEDYAKDVFRKWKRDHEGRKPEKQEKRKRNTKVAKRRQRQRQVRTKGPVFSIQTDIMVYRSPRIAARLRQPLER